MTTATAYNLATGEYMDHVTLDDATTDTNTRRDEGNTVHEYDTTDRNGQPLHITQIVAPANVAPWDGYIYETTRP